MSTTSPEPTPALPPPQRTPTPLPGGTPLLVSPEKLAWLEDRLHTGWHFVTVLLAALGFVWLAVLVSQRHWYRYPVRKPRFAPTRARAYLFFVLEAIVHSLVVFFAWSLNRNVAPRVVRMQSALFALFTLRLVLRVVYLYVGGALRRFVFASIIGGTALCLAVAEAGIVFAVVSVVGVFYLCLPLLMAALEFALLVATALANSGVTPKADSWRVAVLADAGAHGHGDAAYHPAGVDDAVWEDVTSVGGATAASRRTAASSAAVQKDVA
jgi:tryptophan-rich sensory protein